MSFGKLNLGLGLGAGGGGANPDAGKFISTWKTNNTGVSTSSQIRLPLLSTGTYNFTVEWGDGSSDVITAYNQSEITHTYSSAGTYTVKISGTCRGFSFNNGGDKNKITGISQWGTLRLGNGTNGQHFYDAVNLNITATDAPDLSTSSVLALSFRGINSFTGSMADWDFTGVTNTANMFAFSVNVNPTLGACLSTMGDVQRAYRMFKNCGTFNQDVSDMDISSMTAGSLNGLDDIFGGTALSTAHYDAFLISMAAQAPTAAPNLILGASGITYSSAASAARTTLTGTYGWTITDGGLV